jgi:hypothetical protein
MPVEAPSGRPRPTWPPRPAQPRATQRAEQAEELIQQALNARDQAVLATLGPALRLVLDRLRDLEAERLLLRPEWSFRYGDGEYATKKGALKAAANQGYGTEGDAAVCWRLVGAWQDAGSAPASADGV